MKPNEKQTILRAFDQAFDARSWHGTNLRGSLRGLSLDDLVYRPRQGGNTIWELAVHCAYWKYAVRRRLTGEKRGGFALEGSNFFARPSRVEEADGKAWQRDVRLLVASHAALRKTIVELPPRRLEEISRGGSRVPNRDVLLGIAAHDLYHAGQIQLLKRLARDARPQGHGGSAR
jgi:uncharacterized damage-inducible protein DinB